jgi:hypothetical protein
MPLSRPFAHHKSKIAVALAAATGPDSGLIRSVGSRLEIVGVGLSERAEAPASRISR